MQFVGHECERTLEALDWINTLIADDLLHIVADNIRFQVMGRAMFLMGGYFNVRDVTLGRRVTEYRFGLMPIPRGPQSDSFTTRTFSNSMFYVAADAVNHEEAAAIMVSMANRWARTNIIEHELRYGLQFEECAEVMAHLLEVAYIDFSRALGSTRSSISQAYTSIILGNQTPRQALESIALYIQNSLDTITDRFHE